MYKDLNKLIKLLLIKKIIKSGKQTKALNITKKLYLLKLNNDLFKKIILALMLPIKFEEKKIGSVKYKIPKLIHYYKSINIALSWYIKASKLKSHNKMPMYKAMFLEGIDVLNSCGYAYSNFRQQTIKKALISRVFTHLLSKKNKNIN